VKPVSNEDEDNAKPVKDDESEDSSPDGFDNDDDDFTLEEVKILASAFLS